MWMHSNNPNVCNAALTALCNMCVNVVTNQVLEITSEEVDVIVNTMRNHQTVREVQESSIILLRNFSFSRTNLSVMERNQFLVPLIRSGPSNVASNRYRCIPSKPARNNCPRFIYLLLPLPSNHTQYDMHDNSPAYYRQYTGQNKYIRLKQS